jgi:hypothetical protein
MTQGPEQPAAQDRPPSVAAQDSPAANRPPPPADRTGRIWVLAFATVLIPGILVFIALRAAGAPLGPAGLLGLLVMLVSSVAYPLLLKRLGWVDRR